MRHTLLVLIGISTLAGCAASPGDGVRSLTGPTGVGAASLVAGQQISVTPTFRLFGCFEPLVPVTVTATTNFAGLITTSIDNPNGCTVSPGSQEAVATPGNGGAKSAIFTITPTLGCTVTFTDKKGNTATAVTFVQDSGSAECWV